MRVETTENGEIQIPSCLGKPMQDGSDERLIA